MGYNDRELNAEWLIDWHNHGNGSYIADLLSKYYKKPIKNDIHIWKKLDNAMEEILKTEDWKGGTDMADGELMRILRYGNRLAKPAILTIEKLKNEGKLYKIVEHEDRKNKKSTKPKRKVCKCKK